MAKEVSTTFGIDLGTTYSCIAYVDEFGKPVVIPNREGEYTTPSVVHFEGSNRIVGREAKNSAVLAPSQVVEMVKRQMGETSWRFHCEGVDYTPEEISAYILRKLADDAELALDRPVKDVVITCPAYFGIAQRDATVKAGQIAGLNVQEIINEPTAAAIVYGLQEENDQTVLVYDLGGGTFDITVIEIQAGNIRVVATGGNQDLGGRNWDEAVVQYLANQWLMTNDATDNPLDSEETLQELWGRAEEAKKALSARNETRVQVAHAGKRVGLTLTRAKFNELTAHLLERTIAFTRETMEEARRLGSHTFDKMLLVGGSTRMPQVEERLKAEFNLPLRSFDPEQAVAKGAALYGHKLMLGEKIKSEIADMTGAKVEQINMEATEKKLFNEAIKRVALEEGLVLGAVQKAIDMKVTNVASHSFGIIATDKRTNREVISNIVLVNDPLPTHNRRYYTTQEGQQATVEIKVIENKMGSKLVDDLRAGREIGTAVLHLPYGVPPESPIEVTFDLQRDGRLHVMGCEPSSGVVIEADIQTTHGISETEFQEAKERTTKLNVS